MQSAYMYAHGAVYSVSILRGFTVYSLYCTPSVVHFSALVWDAIHTMANSCTVRTFTFSRVENIVVDACDVGHWIAIR